VHLNASSRLARAIALAVGFLIVGSAGVPTPLADEAVAASENPFEVLVEEGRLSVTVREAAPLADIIGEISRLARTELHVHGDLGSAAQRSFKDLPLDEGIRRLVGRHSLVLRYRGLRFADESRHEPVLRSIHVYQHKRASGGPTKLVDTRPPPEVQADTPLDEATRRALSQRQIVQLSYRRDAAALQELQRLLASGEDAQTRRDAANALASIANPEALDALDRVGLADKDAQVRVQAARGLLLARGKAAHAAISQVLAREQDPSIRKAFEEMLVGHLPRLTREQASRVRVPR
jgi:hypothetical protein